MPWLLGLFVALIGLAALPAEARDRWPKGRHCDGMSAFCAGPGGLEYRGPPRFYGVPDYARPDRHVMPPPVVRPRWHAWPGRHVAPPPVDRPPAVRPDWHAPPEPRRDPPRRAWRPGPVICDPGRGVCYQTQSSERRGAGFTRHGLDGGVPGLYRPRHPGPHSGFRPEWR